MQVHAFDKKEMISAESAERRKNYTCAECLYDVRVRGGKRRALHFFHLRRNRLCRQSQKGIIHIKLQERIQSFFEDAEMEVAFPSIGRIADVACSSSKIVYEIQYSPMSAEEAQSRTRDYAQVGYTVVWILHDHTFNKLRKTPLEQFLRAFPHYYASVDEKGGGHIYDQPDRSFPKEIVHLQKRRPLPRFKWPKGLQNRARSWPFYHEGDHLDRALSGEFPTRKKKLLRSLKELYLGLLHISLERSSR